MGTDCSLPGPLDFGMPYRQTLRILNHSICFRVKLEDSCSAVAIKYRDHIIVEYMFITIIIMYRAYRILALLYSIAFLVFLQKSIVIL